MIRGFARGSSQSIGNAWVDLTRITLYVLLPLALAFAVFLISQGVIQNFAAYQNVTTLENTTQTLAMGPVASQEAIKMIGINSGGFFNVNSAHPYENPTPLSNFVELLAILLIPAALCHTFGRMVGDTRQGWAVLAAMTIIFVTAAVAAIYFEQQGNPLLTARRVDQNASALQTGGNMEGKETRFGIAASSLWAVATTAASNGSVNSMHDSYTPWAGWCPWP
jgi:K+-transporting ATPase ATPase A chain